jgi:hypothetical protein
VERENNEKKFIYHIKDNKPDNDKLVAVDGDDIP